MLFRLGELFCGAGGLALGAFQAGKDHPISDGNENYEIVHAWANDADHNACRTYAANLVLEKSENQESIKDAVITVDEWIGAKSRNLMAKTPSVISGRIEGLAQHLNKLPPIDGFAFGFPCNDFSSVGERKGLNGDFGPLYTYGVGVLNIHKPKWFVAENVAGLIHREKGAIFTQIVCDLEQAGPGYEVTSHLYSFEGYGVPQNRKRLIMVGIAKPEAERLRENGIEFRVPAPTIQGQPRSAEWGLTHDPFMPDVLKPLPVPSADKEGGFPNHRRLPMNDIVIKRLEHTLPGQNAWNAEIPEEYALKVKKAHLSQIYRRLKKDEPAYTITGNGGGGTHGYHWEHPRALTNRERARLQSFPDSFILHGGEESVRRQIGMAVPPLAAKVIFEAILKTFAGVPYPYVQPHVGVLAEQRLKQASLELKSV